MFIKYTQIFSRKSSPQNTTDCSSYSQKIIRRKLGRAMKAPEFQLRTTRTKEEFISLGMSGTINHSCCINNYLNKAST